MNIEYFSRNKRLLADGDGKREFAIDNIVNLNWWHIRYGQDNKNFYDVCSPLYYEDGIKILYDKLKYKKIQI